MINEHSNQSVEAQQEVVMNSEPAAKASLDDQAAQPGPTAAAAAAATKPHSPPIPTRTYNDVLKQAAAPAPVQDNMSPRKKASRAMKSFRHAVKKLGSGISNSAESQPFNGASNVSSSYVHSPGDFSANLPHETSMTATRSKTMNLNPASAFTARFRSKKPSTVKMNLYIPPRELQIDVKLAAVRTRFESQLNPSELECGPSKIPIHANTGDLRLPVDVEIVKFNVRETEESFFSALPTEDDNEGEQVEEETSAGPLVKVGRRMSSQEATLKRLQGLMLDGAKVDTNGISGGSFELIEEEQLDFMKLGLIDIREGEQLHMLGLYTEPRFLVRNAIGQYGLVKLSDLDWKDQSYWLKNLTDKSAIEMLFE